jgi:TRAP-type C4-dicarboxylate transport system permease large subunit
MLPVLGQMNMPRERAAAIIAMASVYGMIAPPVNIIVMIIGGGIDMPYIGFDLILLLITVPLAILTTVHLGYRHARTVDPQLAAAALRGDGAPAGRMLYLPLVVVAVLMIGPKALPQIFPDPRLPLTFAIGSLLGLCVGRKFSAMDAARQAITDILPVVGILMGVGLLIQIMTLTGIRGSIAVNSLSLPPALLLLSIAVSLPLFGGISVFGHVADRGHGQLHAPGGADGRHRRPGGRGTQLLQGDPAPDRAGADRHRDRGRADRLRQPGRQAGRPVRGASSWTRLPVCPLARKS